MLELHKRKMKRLMLVMALLVTSKSFAESDITDHEKACDDGVIFSCSLLGSLYQWGDGIGQDHQKAVSYYKKACGAGSSYSCLMLGSMYEFGEGVAKNDSQALQFLEMACDLKEKQGCDASARLNKKLGR